MDYNSSPMLRRVCDFNTCQNPAIGKCDAKLMFLVGCQRTFCGNHKGLDMPCMQQPHTHGANCLECEPRFRSRTCCTVFWFVLGLFTYVISLMAIALTWFTFMIKHLNEQINHNFLSDFKALPYRAIKSMKTTSLGLSIFLGSISNTTSSHGSLC